MNVKELRKLLALVVDIIEEEDVMVCIDDSRDGQKSILQVSAKFVKNVEGNVVLLMRRQK